MRRALLINRDRRSCWRGTTVVFSILSLTSFAAATFTPEVSTFAKDSPEVVAVMSAWHALSELLMTVLTLLTRRSVEPAFAALMATA